MGDLSDYTELKDLLREGANGTLVPPREKAICGSALTAIEALEERVREIRKSERAFREDYAAKYRYNVQRAERAEAELSTSRELCDEIRKGLHREADARGKAEAEVEQAKMEKCAAVDSLPVHRGAYIEYGDEKWWSEDAITCAEQRAERAEAEVERLRKIEGCHVSEDSARLDWLDGRVVSDEHGNCTLKMQFDGYRHWGKLRAAIDAAGGQAVTPEERFRAAFAGEELHYKHREKIVAFHVAAVNAAISEEREQCARVADYTDRFVDVMEMDFKDADTIATEIAAAIRARQSSAR